MATKSGRNNESNPMNWKRQRAHVIRFRALPTVDRFLSKYSGTYIWKRTFSTEQNQSLIIIAFYLESIIRTKDCEFYFSSWEDFVHDPARISQEKKGKKRKGISSLNRFCFRFLSFDTKQFSPIVSITLWVRILKHGTLTTHERKESLQKTSQNLGKSPLV